VLIGIPAATLDEIVLTDLKQRVLAPDRIADLLKSLVEPQAAISESAHRRLLTLQSGEKTARSSVARHHASSSHFRECLHLLCAN
jgi:hypothetical protein